MTKDQLTSIIIKAKLAVDAVNSYIAKYKKSPATYIQAVKDFQDADGTLYKDGLYGPNSNAAAKWYLQGMSNTIVPAYNPAMGKTKAGTLVTITWKPPVLDAPKPAPVVSAPKPAPKPTETKWAVLKPVVKAPPVVKKITTLPKPAPKVVKLPPKVKAKVIKLPPKALAKKISPKVIKKVISTVASEGKEAIDTFSAIPETKPIIDVLNTVASQEYSSPSPNTFDSSESEVETNLEVLPNEPKTSYWGPVLLTAVGIGGIFGIVAISKKSKKAA